MSEGKLFSKTKASELKAELDQAFRKSKPQPRVKIVLKKVVANIILNNGELVALFPDIVQLMKLDDMEIRKSCFHYIANYAHLVHHNVSAEALPYFQRFVVDQNPILRTLSLRTLSAVSSKQYVELTFNVIETSLQDQNPYVRKSAAYAVSKLYQHDPERTIELQLIDKLNELLYDVDPVVVSNTLAALSFITEQQQGKVLTLTIDKNHALTLVGFLAKTNEWSQIYILNSLLSFIPQTQADALDIIDKIIPSLQHENSAVVLDTIKCIIYLSNYVKAPELVIPTLLKRLGSSLVSLLLKKPEIQFLVLRNVILLLLGKRGLCQFDVELFFCKYDDPIFIKDTKLEIIYLLANEKNANVVLRELEEYATEVDVPMARKAIRAIGNLAVKLPGSSIHCVEVITELISNGISYILQESAIVVKNILRKYPGKFNFAIPELLNHYKLIDEPDSKIAVIWIIGQYCEVIDKCDTALEFLISTFKEEPTEVQLASLTTVTKYYLKVPGKGEQMMLKVLQWATEEVDNPDVRDRGFFYWRLLSSNASTATDFQVNAKRIVLNNDPFIVTDNDNIDPAILEELELNIGSLASIYLKPVQLVFRLTKRKQLTKSPALQPRTIHENTYGNGNNNDNIDDIEYAPSPPKVPPSRLKYSRDDGSPLSSSRSKFNTSQHRPLSTSDTSYENDSPEESARQSFAKKLTRKASFLGRKK